MKIYVYAICKNESAFIDRWVASMSEADGIFVLDTGSTDGSAEKLRAHEGVSVSTAEVSPWRFDTARNLSLSLVPKDADVCVCTDLDEVFTPGWRQAFERAAESRAQTFSYRYVWSFDENGEERTVFNIAKAHRRNGFTWKHPVHEVLTFAEGEPAQTFVEGVRLEHRPDPSKSRKQYLPLLELSVREDPNDDRNMHYLGREYMFARRFPEAIETLKKHLAMPTAVWKDERCASMRYIAACYRALGFTEEAHRWYLRACAEADHLREPWMDLALICYDEQNWSAVIALTSEALKIKEQPETYICDARYRRGLPYDLLSLAYYHVGDKKRALEAVDRALAFSPGDERLKKNRAFFV